VNWDKRRVVKDPFDSHLVEQRLEDYDFLSARGLSLSLIAIRLGLSREQLEKMVERRRSGAQTHTHPAAGAGEVA